MDTRNYVEVASFPTSFEASLAKNLLESNGIASFLGEEAVASWFWQYGPAIKGVRLLVQHEQADAARCVLDASKDESDECAAEEAAFWDTEAERAEALPADLLRAWRAAVIGLVVCPVLLNIYSMWLLCDRCNQHGLVVLA